MKMNQIESITTPLGVNFNYKKCPGKNLKMVDYQKSTILILMALTTFKMNVLNIL